MFGLVSPLRYDESESLLVHYPGQWKHATRGGKMLTTMSRKKRTEKDDSAHELWVSPKPLLKGPAGERAWENRPGGVPNTARFLELADLALGLKKQESRKKKPGTGTHLTVKTGPYTEQK